ncbi:MAG: ATP-grasp domain-containing protein [Chitinivibrionales bacterium]|nr:ATP-grasp domain-containing protein [Chitinivibrionales bacterium]
MLLGLQFSLVSILGGTIPVINDLNASLFHKLKAYQYHLLHAQGVTVPRTLVTSCVDRARAFVRSLDGRVVAKPNTSAAEVVMADESFFAKNGAVIPERPFIFQQFVSGRSYRAYVIGGRIVSAGEFFFDRTYVDWRERIERYEVVELEEETEEQISRAVEILGLGYCAVDFEYDTVTRKYYLLDFNPGGLYMGWSKMAGVDIPALLVDYFLFVLKNGGRIWYDNKA